jgi:hypothetical protein
MFENSRVENDYWRLKKGYGSLVLVIILWSYKMANSELQITASYYS